MDARIARKRRASERKKKGAAGPTSWQKQDTPSDKEGVGDGGQGAQGAGSKERTARRSSAATSSLVAIQGGPGNTIAQYFSVEFFIQN